MTYMIDDPSEIGPRKFQIVDMPRFARDLSELLGYAPTSEKRDNLWTLMSPDGNLVVEVYNEQWTKAKAKRVIISCYLPDVPPGDRPSTSGRDGQIYAMPSITVSADRHMASIAADVIRRVIEPSVAPAAEIRRYQAEQLAQRGNLAYHIAAMEAKHGTNIRFHKDRMNTYSCGFSYYTDSGNHRSTRYGKVSVEGRVNSDGGIYIDRISSINTGIFASLIDIMEENNAA